jgi:hypothetical protein
MTTRRRSTTRLSRQAGELALAVPQVVAHRLTRMALAGPTLSARDRKEFHGMGQEKVVAFWQSWFGMGWAVLQMWQKAWLAGLMGARAPAVDLNRIWSQGLAPVHRKATANAKRLARTSLR